MHDRFITRLADLPAVARARGAAELLQMDIVEFVQQRPVPKLLRQRLAHLVGTLDLRTLQDLSGRSNASRVQAYLSLKQNARLVKELNVLLDGHGPPEASPADGHRDLWPGMPMQRLKRWAKKNGVRQWVDKPLNNGVDLSWHYWYGARSTLGDLVCGEPWQSPWTYLIDRDRMRELQVHFIRVWRRVAEDLAAGLAEESERAAARVPPSDPELARLFDEANKLRERQRKGASPLAAGAPCMEMELRVAEDPPGVVCLAKGELPCSVVAKTTQVALLRDDAERWRLDCDCPREHKKKACVTRLAALDRILDVLGDEAAVEIRESLARELARPGWDRAIDRLLGAVQTEADTGLTADGMPARFVWRLKVMVRSGLVMSLTPGLARARKSGKGVVVRNLSMERAREIRDRLPRDEDREVLELLTYHGTLQQGWNRQYAEPLFRRILRSLAGHPDVYTAVGGARPIEIQARTVTVHMRRGKGGVRVGLKVGESDISPETLLDTLDEQGDGPGLRWHPAEPRLELLEVSGGVLRVARHLREQPMRLPLEAVPKVVDRFAPLTRAGEMRLDTRVLGARLEADVTPGVELSMATGRLRVSLYVLPLAEGALNAPGQGEALCMALSKGVVVHAERDLQAEEQAAEALWRRLELPAPTGPFTVELPDMDAALALVERLRALQEEVESRWDGERLRSLGEVKADSLSLSVTAGKDWFELSGELRLEGATVPLSALLAAVRDKQRYVKIEGQGWVRLDARLRRRLSAWADGQDRPRLGVLGAPALLALQDDGAEVEGPARWLQVADRVREAAGMQPEPPDTLCAELRAYQVEGFRWLARLSHWAPGAVLADDMGLGKTVQALALLLRRAEAGPALVVAPTSVGFNWLREVERFAPSLEVKPLRNRREAHVLEDLRGGDLVLTSWEMATRQVDALRAVRWTTIVLDEAQAMKNPATRRAQAIAKLKGDFVVALTGTPLENRTGELWSLMRVISPGLLGSQKAFRDRFAVPVERHKDRAAAAALAALIAPFMLRRLKSEVAAELPPRTETRVDIELSPGERRQYDQLRRSVLAATSGADGPEQSKLRFVLLAALTRLRQMACHPALLDPQTDLPSAKLAVLRRLIGELHDEGHKALVFSQFTSLLALVREALEADGKRCLQLDGSVPARKRKNLVDAFQRGEADIFLLSIKAGGVGLNLTAASYVFHLDPWWNPAVEDQATDRAHRIGQDKAVSVYRLVSRGTVEEAIYDLHRDKRDLVDAVLAGTGEAKAMSIDKLRELLAISAGQAPEMDAPEPHEIDPDPVTAPANEPPGDGARPRSRRRQGPVVATWDPDAPQALELEVALERIEGHLRRAVAVGRLSRPASAQGYRVKIARMLRWMVKQGRPLSEEGLRQSEEDYRQALVTGAWKAPRSDLSFVKSVVRWGAEGLQGGN